MEVVYFRTRKPGPEAKIEDAVVNRVPELFGRDGQLLWMGGALPIGAGVADVVVVLYHHDVIKLAKAERMVVDVLAYLRSINAARLSTIVTRTAHPEKAVARCLHELVREEVVCRESEIFSLTPLWRVILPEVIIIEAKVKNWRKAVEQAGRNKIFAHRSFVALPERIAQRVRSKPIFKQLGVGLLSIRGDNEVEMIRRGQWGQPRVWSYYYRIALIVGKYFKDKG